MIIETPIWSNQLQAEKREEMEAIILFSTNVYFLKHITFLMEYLDKLHRLLPCYYLALECQQQYFLIMEITVLHVSCIEECIMHTMILFHEENEHKFYLFPLIL